MPDNAPIVTSGSTTNRDFSKAEKGENKYAKAQTKVNQFSSNGLVYHDVMRVLQNSLDIASGKALVDASKAASSAAEKRRRLSPGSFSIGAVDYSNRPVIQIVKGDISTNRSGEQPIGEFTDFYLNSVTETDLERTDVVETFGEPHLFTSGRFCRKFTFAGNVRTTCANPSSTSAASRVPQHTLLRVFYDRYMRSTAQAQFNYFTRVIVDGDIYEGYVINLNMARDASVEMTMPFSFTMIVLRRYHMNDNDAIQVLSRFNGETRRRIPPSFASAEMRDAVGNFDVKLSIGNEEPTTSLDYNTGKVKPDGSFSGISQLLNLHAPYAGQTLTVSGSGSELWSLVYADDGVDVSGTPSRAGKSLVSLKLKNYAKVLELTSSTNGVNTSDLLVKSSVDGGANLRVSSSANDKPLLLLSTLELVHVDATWMGGATGSQPNAYAVEVPAANKFFADAGDQQEFSFGLTLSLSSAAGPLTSQDIPASPTEYVEFIVGNAAPTRAGLVTTFPGDTAIVGTVDASSIVVSSPNAGQLDLDNLAFSLVLPDSIVDASPFSLTDIVRVPVTVRINFPGYQPLEANIVINLNFGAPTLISSIFAGGRIDRSATPGRKWNFTKLYDGYYAVLTLNKSDSAVSKQVSVDNLKSIMLASELNLRFNGGAVRTRLGFGSSSTVRIANVDRSFQVTSQISSVDARGSVVIGVTFKPQFDTSEVSELAILNEIGNPVTATLELAPAVKQSPVQIST